MGDIMNSTVNDLNAATVMDYRLDERMGEAYL